MKGNQKAKATVSAIIDGTGSVGKEGDNFFKFMPEFLKLLLRCCYWSIVNWFYIYTKCKSLVIEGVYHI